MFNNDQKKCQPYCNIVKWHNLELNTSRIYYEVIKIWGKKHDKIFKCFISKKVIYR